MPTQTRLGSSSDTVTTETEKVDSLSKTGFQVVPLLTDFHRLPDPAPAVEGRLPLFDRPNALDLSALDPGANSRPLDIVLEYRRFSQLHVVIPGLHAHFGRRGRTDLHFSREA